MTPERLRELCDRQDIVDCLHRYCRGVDRFDRALLLSAYHPGAIDDHGSFVGPAEAFVDWAFAYHREHQLSHHHAVLNTTIDFAGDTAHTETYWQFVGVNRSGPALLALGRYVDRFERRDGRWAIAARVCVTESVHALPDAASVAPNPQQPAHASTRDRHDVSYQRPLLPRTPG